MIANLLVFVGIAIVGGLGSSWYMIERGSQLTTRSVGPWVIWSAAGRVDADPYTRAHFIRRGMLMVSSSFSQTFEAREDDQGQWLHSSCEYMIEGLEPPANYWSLGVFDEMGRLIPNPADRYSHTQATVMRPANGRLEIALARAARPGNWLPIGGAGRVVLLLSVDELRAPSGSDAQATSWKPPAIKRVACR